MFRSSNDQDTSIRDLSHAPEIPTEHRRLSLGESFGSSGTRNAQRRNSVETTDSVQNRSPSGRMQAVLSPRIWTSRNQNIQDDASSPSSVRLRLRSTGALDDSTGSGNRSRIWSTGNASSSSVASLPSAPRLNHVLSFPPVASDHNSRDTLSASGNKRVSFTDSSLPSQTPRLSIKPDANMIDLPEGEPSEVDYGYETMGLELNSARARTESYASESVFSDGTSHNDAEEDDTTNEVISEAIYADDDVNRVLILGRPLPLWMTNRPSWNRVAGCIVTRSPCFWYCFSKQPTDREILARLNILTSFVGVIQLASVMWLIIVSFSDSLVSRTLPLRSLTNSTITQGDNRGDGIEILLNFWNLNGAVYVLGFLGFIIFTSAVLTFRVIRNVNLVGAIRYLWVLLWMVPFEILFVIGLFDYFRVTDVWIKHWWRDRTLAWFRRSFCRPYETYNTLCTVPIMTAAEEKEWCSLHFNSTACTRIRNAAQSDMQRSMLSFYWLNAGVGLIMICLLFLTIMTLEGIVSRPLVQKSRESNVPAWFALPAVGSIVIGVVYGYASSSGLNTETETEASFIGPLFLAIGALFLFLTILGRAISAYSILSTRNKHTKLVMILAFIASAAIIIILLATVFSSSIAFTISLRAVPISNSERGNIACFLDSVNGCTGCDLDNPDLMCPEWTRADVTKVIQTQAKGAASLAAIFIIYAFSALRFGFVLRKHVTTYQIDYV